MLPEYVELYFVKKTSYFHKRTPEVRNFLTMQGIVFRAVHDKLNFFKRASENHVELSVYIEMLNCDCCFQNLWKDINPSLIDDVCIDSGKVRLSNNVVKKTPFDTSVEDDMAYSSRNIMRWQVDFGLEASFFNFQCWLVQIILPIPENNINQLFTGKKVPKGTIILDIEQDARKANVFCKRFALSNTVLFRKSLNSKLSSSNIVNLVYDAGTMSLVYGYALALYENVVVYLESCFSEVSKIITILLPDQVKARLLFEISYHLYIASKTTPYDAPGEVKLLEQTVSLLWQSLHSMVEDVRRKPFFLKLRDDHRVLLLVHLVFTEIRLSIVIATELK